MARLVDLVVFDIGLFLLDVIMNGFTFDHEFFTFHGLLNLAVYRNHAFAQADLFRDLVSRSSMSRSSATEHLHGVL